MVFTVPFGSVNVPTPLMWDTRGPCTVGSGSPIVGPSLLSVGSPQPTPMHAKVRQSLTTQFYCKNTMIRNICVNLSERNI